MAVVKVLAQPDSKKAKQIGEVAAGSVVVGMDSRMDRRGRTFIYHRAAGVPGWSATHSDDNMPVLVPVVAKAAPARASVTGGAPAQSSASTSGVAITAGSYVVVKVKAPFFRLHERDSQVQGLLEQGEVLQVMETKADGAGRVKVRHSRGWTPVLAPDNSVVLESTKQPTQSQPLAQTVATTKQPSHSEPSAETVAASAVSAKAQVEPQELPPTSAQPEPQSNAAAPRVRPQRSQSMRLEAFAEDPLSLSADLAPFVEDQDASPKYVPRGRLSGRLSGGQSPGSRVQQTPAQTSGPKQTWQKVRSSMGDGRLQSIGDRRTTVRLLYVSGAHGFGMEYGVNDLTMPIVVNYLGDSAKRAGVILGSVIAAVDGLPVTSIQHLAQVLTQKEHIARQFTDAAVEFELVPPPAARPDDLLALVGSAPLPLADIAETAEPAAADPKVSELQQIAEQIRAVGEVAAQLLRDLPGLRASLAAATTEQAKTDLREEISDNESALKQQQVTQSQLFKKQLKLIAENCEELTKQRDFQIAEAEKFVAFQIKHIVDRESAIKGKQDKIRQARAQMAEQTKAQDQKQAALMAQHSESTAPLKAQMDVHVKEVAALDEEIAALIATLKAKQKVRDETMDKADELQGSITAQLKLFAAPALEQIELERKRLAQMNATLQKQQDAVAAEVSAAREGRAAAADTRTQREGQVASTTTELRRLHELGGRSAMALERLRTDGEARAKIVSAKSSATKVALADAERAVEELEASEAGEAARSLQSLGESIPQLEAETAALKTRLEKLEAAKLGFAKAKQFKEAGQAKKDIDAAEEQLTQLEARLVKERATAASSTAQDEAKSYATKLLAAQQAAAAGRLQTLQTYCPASLCFSLTCLRQSCSEIGPWCGVGRWRVRVAVNPEGPPDCCGAVGRPIRGELHRRTDARGRERGTVCRRIV